MHVVFKKGKINNNFRFKRNQKSFAFTQKTANFPLKNKISIDKTNSQKFV